MFRMKFLSAPVDDSTSSDEDDDRSGDSSGRRSSPPDVVCCVGKVVKVTKSRPLPFADGHSSLRSLILCPSAVQVVPLPNPEAESVEAAPVPAEAAPVPVEAALVSKPNDGVKDEMALHNQDSSKDQAPKVVVVQETGARAVLVDAESDSESSEYSTPTHQSEAEDEALTEIINRILEERKTILQKSVDTFTKSSEEPLLAAHDQGELDVLAKDEAKVEAMRIAEEERLQRARDLRELRALANCTTTVLTSERSLGRSSTFKKSGKLKKILSKTGVTTIYRFLRSPFRIFRKRHTAYADAREAKVVVRKPGLFTDRTTRGGAQLAMMKNAPQPGLTRIPHIQFTTVESTQRDGPAWTREEYLRKNGRIPQHLTTSSKEDEELGGIMGNNLMNQYFDDGTMTDYDSDSD